jgi:hypothetical protein
MSKQTTRIALGVALLWFAFTAATHLWFMPRKSDFRTRWYGAREVLHGRSPYALPVTPDMLYAKKLPDRAFLYPATIAYTLLPFWLLPMNTALSFWCGLQLVFFSLLPLLIYRNLGWKPPPLHYALIVLLSFVGFPYSWNVYTLGQFTGVCLAGLVLAWWGVSRGHHLVAALSLALATTRPEGAVLAAAVLVFLLAKRQFAVPVIWLAAMIGVLLLSLLQIGWWVPDFLEQVRAYQAHGENFRPPQLLSTKVVEFLFVVGLLLWGGGLLRQVWAWPDQDLQLLWGLSVIIVLVLLLLPQTNDYTLVYLLLPIWLLLWRGRRSPTTLLLWLWLPLMSYVAKYGYESTGREAEAFLWHNQFLTPLVIAALLTYEWSRLVRTPLQPQRALGGMAEPAP